MYVCACVCVSESKRYVCTFDEKPTKAKYDIGLERNWIILELSFEIKINLGDALALHNYLSQSH